MARLAAGGRRNPTGGSYCTKLAEVFVRGLFLLVKRTAHGETSAVKDVSVDHCCLDVLVAEEFLDCSDVIAGF
jgi:hypothetical protein